MMNISLLLLQAQPLAATEQSTESLGLWDLAVKGGWIMVLLAILSIIAVYIFSERFSAIRRAQKVDVNFMNQIKEYIHEDKIDAAKALCNAQNTPVSRMILKGIERIGRPVSDVNTAIENVGNLEISKLESGLPTLASIAGGSPMLGFLGTVIGLIQAFYEMSKAGGNLEMGLLSGGIYTAMVTTVGGLFVGIAAYFGYNILVAKIEKVVFNMEHNTIEFMDLLNEPVE
ncbi:MotA/TolQ/ExbB proton channel family protein [Williamwhitmania taraxaci]|uniref:Outer membrane transport energization protein ExbB n=1 Tax=Williamwhitmania taraxaci TaxID=1640674 RepID=A0A1G6M3G6_9BACT|nr:MotA/TolQ/ExbB proton channel family protein [Williamwhitmania taraxaci]SDC49991.1 outer membrane transport energization protein ExbB [Williamwhitmania taraxaci]